MSERDDSKPGWYKQTESEFGAIFGPEADDQKALNDWATLEPDERDFYIGKLLYLNLRAQYHIARTNQAMLQELRAVAADEDEPEPAPRRGARRPPGDEDGPVGSAPVRATGPVTDVSQLPADVQAEIRKHARPVVVPDAVTPDEVIPRDRGAS